MKTSVAINGFGRIGRLSLRALLQQSRIAVVAINDVAPPATLAHLCKYDSNQGAFPRPIDYDAHHLYIDGQPIAVYTEPDPAKLPWKALGVSIVIEATGLFTHSASASRHLAAGAQQVIISAPAQDVPTVVLGVNDTILAPTPPPILSSASCTTYCLAPMAKVLDDAFGIESGYINTIHAYTADQTLQDAPHKDLRRARAAAQSIIPTSTGAAQAVGLVLPHLQGKLAGIALRVPVSVGSVTDFTVLVKQPVSRETINAHMRQAAEGPLKGILAYTEEPIVSVDIIGNPHACIVDAQLTAVNGPLVKVMGWYDNETGYAHRIADLVYRLSRL